MVEMCFLFSEYAAFHFQDVLAKRQPSRCLLWKTFVWSLNIILPNRFVLLFQHSASLLLIPFNHNALTTCLSSMITHAVGISTIAN